MTAPLARQATPDDVDELVRLRAVMFEGFELPDAGPPREGWQARARTAFLDGMAAGRLVAFVAEAPDGAGLASCAVGFVDGRLPGPFRDGSSGHVSSVATDPRWRRQGLARAVVAALVAWFDQEGVERVQLSASSEGEGLYRRLGFAEGHNPVLIRRRR
ncbi:hypothetical protein GCM10027446_06620 [Angustibacter peucedani]